MAESTDLQRMLISLEASFVKYERSWQRAQGITDTNVKQTEKKFDRVATKVNNSFQTANIASQFQDIAVQLQAGTSPLTIALQQGTQLSQALGPGQGLKGTISALGAAFGSLVSPVSLATIALIAAGGFAFEYFSTLLDNGEASEEQLKKQDDLIRKIADRWGDAVPAVKAYVEARDQAQQDKETAEGFEALITQAWVDARQAARDAGSEFTAILGMLSLAGLDTSESVYELNREFAALEGAVKAGNATTEQAQRVSALLAEVIQTSNIPAIQSYVGVFEALTTAIAGATQAQRDLLQDQQTTSDTAGVKQAFIDEQTRLNLLTSEQLQLEAEIARVKADAERGNTVLTEQEALDIAQQRLAAEERRAEITKGERAGGKAADEAERERQAVLDLISALQFEQSLIGKSAVDQEVLRTARQAGAAATDQQRQAIEELVRSNYYEQQQVQALEQAYAQLGDIGKSAVNGIVEALADGRIEGEEFLNLLGDIAGQLGQMFINNAFSSLNGGGFDIGKLFQFRANGGPVQAGRPYIVGEKRPEVFVPSTSGTIIPRVPSQAGGAPVINFSIDARGAQVGVAEQIRAQLDQFSRHILPGRVTQINRDPYAVG